jgi:ABC-type transporter Mla subunit MlaD
MNERTKQFRVGILVFATILMSSLLILWNSDFSALPFRRQYQVKMLVDQAPGVAPETPVRRRGLPIGRVASVEDTDDGALITLNIDEGKQIKSNESGRIQQSLIGDAVIEFSPYKTDEAPQPVPAGATVKGMYAANPIDMLADIQGDLKQTIQSLGRAGDEVATLANQLNQVLGENDMERVTKLVESVDAAMVQFTALTENINDVMGDEEFKKQLKEGLGQLPSVLADARAILTALEGAVTSADANLKNLQGLTGPLGDRGPQIVDAMEKSVRNLQTLLAEVAELSANINNSEGTLGLLIKDRQLHDQLTSTVSQAQATITDVRCLVNDAFIRRKIDQILENVRVLTDKLARDPARIARGVINRETPIK